MNNSDVLVALSLWLATFIFLFQADPALLRIKMRKGEGWIFCVSWVLIIGLVNHDIFDRAQASVYFSLGKFYLTPNEWALLLFLVLFVLICYRVFTPKIFNEDKSALLAAVQKYRSAKKFEKLADLLTMIIQMKDFGNQFGADLDDIVFNDHHLIEQFSGENPDLIIGFTEGFPGASINRGDFLYYVLSGLFSDRSNAIYGEIRRCRTEEIKEPFLDKWDYGIEDVKFIRGADYRTKEKIIRWLSDGLNGFPHLKEDTMFFLDNISAASILDNERSYSHVEIETVLSRDPVYNAIRLFRILLIELSLFRKDFFLVIDRYLVMLYSAWDFILSKAELKRHNVQLNNDDYTINEYLLKYIFEAYCSIYVLNCMKMDTVTKDRSPGWVIQQLEHKLDELWAGNRVNMDSKVYYMQGLVELYYNLAHWLSPDKLPHAGFSILYQLKQSLDKTPFGNATANRQVFDEFCKAFEFYRYNNLPANEQRAQEFYEFLLPYSEKWKHKILDF